MFVLHSSGKSIVVHYLTNTLLYLLVLSFLWPFLTLHAYVAWNEAYKPKRERAEEEKKRWVHFPFWKLITFLTTASTCQNDPLFWRWRARVELSEGLAFGKDVF